MSEKFDYEKYYQKISSIYDRIRLDYEDNFNKTIDIVISNSNKSDKNVIDIGCGTGRYGESLQKKGFSVIGIDKHKSQIEQAENHIKAIQADAAQLPFPDASFDIRTMIMMIHQLGELDRKKSLNEVYRVLRENGTLIIKTCSRDDLHKRLTDRFFPEALKHDLVRYPSIEDLLQELAMFSIRRKIYTRIPVILDKETVIENFKARKSSNLGMLTDAEISQGIEKMKEYHKKSSTTYKKSCNTFIICKKGARDERSRDRQ